MNALTFLEAVLGDDGFFCAFATKDKKFHAQKFYDTKEKLAYAASEFDENGADAFFALGTYSDPNNRKAENVKQLKSFFLDIDCGPEKDYPTKKEGLIAVRDFVETYKLPKPFLIDSGGGIHVYWILEETVSVAEWSPVAKQFKELCLSSDLRIDAAVSEDAARVLRVPLTRNYKKDVARPVSFISKSLPAFVTLEQFKACLPETTAIKLIASEGGQVENQLMQRLLGYTQASFKTIIQKTKEKRGCMQIAYAATKQEEVDEPLWRAALSIAQHCEDRDEYIHKLSFKHAEYDYDETEEKARRIRGPYLCEKFDEFNPGVCPKCPNFNKIKSPIVLGKKLVEAEDSEPYINEEPEEQEPTLGIPPYPKPYFRLQGGGIAVRTRDLDGNESEEEVYPYDIYVSGRTNDPEDGEVIIVNVILPNDGIRVFNMPLSSATNREEFRKLMSMHGVMATGKKLDKLMLYIETWVNHLQASTRAIDARRQFGWTKDCASFVLGRNEYTKDGVKVNHPTTATLPYFPYFEPKGAIEGWLELIESYNKKHLEIHQFLICFSLGSALMELVPNIKAVGLHIYSGDSGFGKTSIKQAMASVWGNPDGLIIDGKDTNNSIFNRAEVFRHVPLLIDEVTKMDNRNIRDLAMMLTTGKQRGRMKNGSNQERYRGEPWAMTATTSANFSLHERFETLVGMPRAEAQRVMEVQVEGYNFNEDSDANEKSMWFNRIIGQNYGLAGPLFVQFVMRNKDKVEEMLYKAQVRLDKHFGLTHQNRFWSAGLTVAFVSRQIGQHLGLIPFSHDALMVAAEDIVETNKRSVQAMQKSVTDIINDFYVEHVSNALIIRSDSDVKKGVHGNPLDSLVKDEKAKNPYYQLAVRYEPDLNYMYLVPSIFKKWCADRQVNYSEFLKKLKKDHEGRIVKKRMMSGTGVQSAPMNAIWIDASKFFKPDDEHVKKAIQQAL